MVMFEPPPMPPFPTTPPADVRRDTALWQLAQKAGSVGMLAVSPSEMSGIWTAAEIQHLPVRD